MFDGRRSVMHLKRWSRHYSALCGCLLERTRHGVLYFPCTGHFGIPHEIDVRQDGGASLFMERGPFLDVLRKRGLMKEGA